MYVLSLNGLELLSKVHVNLNSGPGPAIPRNTGLGMRPMVQCKSGPLTTLPMVWMLLFHHVGFVFSTLLCIKRKFEDFFSLVFVSPSPLNTNCGRMIFELILNDQQILSVWTDLH